MKIFILFVFIYSNLLALDIKYYEDKEASHTYKNIMNEKKFIPYSKVTSNFGMSKSVFWIKVSLLNKEEKNTKKVLNFLYPLLDAVTLYKVENNRLIQHKQEGFLVSKNTRLTEPSLTFELDFPAKERTTYYFKIISQAPMNLSLEAYSYEEFEEHKVVWFSSIAFYTGAVLMIVLYNLILFFFLRVRAYLYYVLFHTGLLLIVLSGHTPVINFFYQGTSRNLIYFMPTLISLTAIVQMLFVYEFIEVKRNAKKTKKLMLAIIFFGVMLLLTSFFTPYRESIMLANVVSLVGVLVPLGVAVYYWLKLKNNSAMFYTISWLLVTAGIIIEHMKNNALIEVNFFTNNVMQLGAMLELLLISKALAYRYSQLEYKNSVLNDMLSIDTLTKIKNRHYFFNTMDNLLSIFDKRASEYALVMLDIDKFKNINDTYGHGVGDMVLIAFSETISKFLRNEDLFARIGGEEFVLFVKGNKEKISLLTQRLKDAIESMEVNYSDDELAVKITVSMGVTLFSDNSKNVKTLLNEADEALYKAKDSGRNRVEFFTY